MAGTTIVDMTMKIAKLKVRINWWLIWKHNSNASM